MTQEEITEGNKLIAEFMGWELISYPTHIKSPFHGRAIWWSPGKTKSFCCIKGEEHFHNSWDWLMPVVEKIESLNYGFEIIGNYCKIIGTNIQCSQASKIKAIYCAVIQFIKWYNQNIKDG